MGRLFSWGIVCVLTCVLMLGCGGGGVSGLVKVTGTVTLDGQPVEGAAVSFSPAGNEGRASAGVTDAQGRFSLAPVGGGQGALPGKYQVAISKTQVTGGAPTATTREEYERQMKERMAQGAAGFQFGPPQVTHLIPQVYSSPATSQLEAEVTASGANDFPFALKSPGG